MRPAHEGRFLEPWVVEGVCDGAHVTDTLQGDLLEDLPLEGDDAVAGEIHGLEGREGGDAFGKRVDVVAAEVQRMESLWTVVA